METPQQAHQAAFSDDEEGASPTAVGRGPEPTSSEAAAAAPEHPAGDLQNGLAQQGNSPTKDLAGMLYACQSMRTLHTCDSYRHGLTHPHPRRLPSFNFSHIDVRFWFFLSFLGVVAILKRYWLSPHDQGKVHLPHTCLEHLCLYSTWLQKEIQEGHFVLDRHRTELSSQMRHYGWSSAVRSYDKPSINQRMLVRLA